ncbi:uncharacterized protein LOC124197983 isoform X1 [Daphnia pulex]|uniref:uncharacterized protein LOC124197983 isoform X1 n=2 Tax=Daphnia pulex TaxID=6669 RepID=UPI001EDD207D|nr:uncharacterized protein LOC124197983 isoform X1 [Daphnia pulex]XP_046449533.1 uncharacterized protein LOC124197983 isoform X1 [Daphnia pulex]
MVKYRAAAAIVVVLMLGVVLARSTTGVLMSFGYGGYETATPHVTTPRPPSTSPPSLQIITPQLRCPSYYTKSPKYYSSPRYAIKGSSTTPRPLFTTPLHIMSEEDDGEKVLSSRGRRREGDRYQSNGYHRHGNNYSAVVVINCVLRRTTSFAIIDGWIDSWCADVSWVWRVSNHDAAVLLWNINIRHDQLLHRGPQVLHHRGTIVLHNYKCRASLLHRDPKYYSAPSYYTEVPAYYTTKTVEYYIKVIIVIYGVLLLGV